MRRVSQDSNATVLPSEGRIHDAGKQGVSERAVVFAKQNRTRIARKLACLETYPSDEYPVSVFMAGSPGAGKTEVSKAFIGMMQVGGSNALRIDPDDFRVYFHEYTGRNSSLFQRGSNDHC